IHFTLDQNDRVLQRHIFKACARSGPYRATSDQAPDLAVLFDDQIDKVIVNARCRYGASHTDEGDARRPFAARLFGSEGGGGAVLRSSPNETGRTEIASQTLDSQHKRSASVTPRVPRSKNSATLRMSAALAMMI